MIQNTERITYPEPDPNAVDPREKAAQLARESSTGPSTQGQPQQPTFSLSDSDDQAERGTSPCRKATPGELDHPTSLQIAHERNRGSNDPPSLLPGMNDKRRRIPEEDNDSQGSTEHRAKLVGPNEKEVARLEHARIADLERQLSETLAAQTERDRRIAQLTDQLAEANAAGAKKRAGPVQHELQAELDELLPSRDQALERAQPTQQAHSALQKATSRAAEANERSQRELAEVHAKLEARESEMAAVRLRLADAEDGWAKSDAKLETRESELAAVRLRLADAEDGWAKSKAEMHAKLETRESELAAVRLRLADAENGWAKSKAEADTSRAGTQPATGLVDTDVGRVVMSRLMERVRALEAEMVSQRRNEKSIEDMECSNEG